MTGVHAEIGTTHYAVSINASGHHLAADEPESKGGENTGPVPHDLLLASLAACTAITLRMYVDRKQWDLKSLAVDVQYVREDDKARIVRELHLDGALSDEQRARIVDIAERTPVTLMLKGGVPIQTELIPLKR